MVSRHKPALSDHRRPAMGPVCQMELQGNEAHSLSKQDRISAYTVKMKNSHCFHTEPSKQASRTGNKPDWRRDACKGWVCILGSTAIRESSLHWSRWHRIYNSAELRYSNDLPYRKKNQTRVSSMKVVLKSIKEDSSHEVWFLTQFENHPPSGYPSCDDSTQLQPCKKEVKQTSCHQKTQGRRKDGNYIAQ